MRDSFLTDWNSRAQLFNAEINKALIGLEKPVQQITIAIFARGHVMLEGNVGVGKTTLLRAVARGIGGAYERVEGTIDLMPNDLVYRTYINEQGKPQVDPGPILKHGESLSTFFFNEVNRARPQVEKDETFEIPSAARDRFMMELLIETPDSPQLQKDLMFNPRYHDVDALIATIKPGILAYQELNTISRQIQTHIQASSTLQNYALQLWQATCQPQRFGINLDDVDMDRLILAGASARGAGMLMRAAKVTAWLNNRTHVMPEDIRDIFHQTIAHRVFFNPTYELRRSLLAA